MTPSRRRRADVRALALQIGAAGALAVTGYEHVQLAPSYELVGDAVTQGQLFYAQAAACALVALAVLVRPVRASFIACAVVGGGSLAAVLLYRYVDVGAVGPFPNMYEPVWFEAKTRSAVADGAALLLGLAGLGYRLRLTRA